MNILAICFLFVKNNLYFYTVKYLGFIAFNSWKIYVGCIFTITLIVFYPVFLVLLNNEKWKPIAFNLCVFWSRCVRIFSFYGVVQINSFAISDTPKVIIANHTSYLDIFLLYSILPSNKFIFLGKSEILTYPLLKTFFKKLNIPVYRKNRVKAARSFMACKKAIENGWSVVIFPEGGIPDDNLPQLIPFKEGAFKLAKSCNVPIFAITYINNYRLFSDPEAIYGSAFPGLAKVHFHPLISEEEINKNTVEDIKEKAFQLISSVLKK